MEENVQYTKQIQSCILPPHIQDICIAYIISWLEQSGDVIKVHLEIKSFCGGGFFFFQLADVYTPSFTLSSSHYSCTANKFDSKKPNVPSSTFTTQP